MSNALRINVIYLLLLTAVFAFFLASLSFGGFYKVSLTDLINVMGSRGMLEDPLRVVIDMRLRRGLTSIAVGAILGVSSIALQNVLRNPLASPFTLGIQHAAALGVGVAMTAFGAISIIGPRSATSSTVVMVNPYVVSALAFAGATIQSFLILFLAYSVGLSIYAVILASIALSFASQAALSLLQYLYFNEVQVATLLFWTFGDVGRVSWFDVWLLLLIASAATVLFTALSMDLDLISLGDEVAVSSGVNVKVVRFVALLTSSLFTAVSVSLVGVIGFAGLLASHAARLTVGWNTRRSVFAATLYGSLIVLAADFLGRVVLNPVTLPVGITTTLVGVPLLIALLLGGRRGVAEGR